MIKGAVGGLAFAGVARGVFGITDALDDIGKKARIAGINVEDFQRQSHAFAKADIELEQYVKSITNTTRRTEEALAGNKEYTESFEALNIDLREFKDLAPDKRMLRLADAYDTAEDKQKAFAALFKILGRDAAKFTDAFRGGAAAINEAGDALKTAVDQATIDKVEELNDKWSDLKTNVRNLGVGGAVGIYEFTKKGGEGLGLLGAGFKAFIDDGFEGVKNVHSEFIKMQAEAENGFLGDPSLGSLTNEQWKNRMDERNASEKASGMALRPSPTGFERFATPSALDAWKASQTRGGGFSGLDGLLNMQAMPSPVRKGRDIARHSEFDPVFGDATAPGVADSRFNGKSIEKLLAEQNAEIKRGNEMTEKMISKLTVTRRN